jgi:HEAT repeat protein
MLGDEKLSHMARYALEAIPDKSVDEALRTALGKLNGKLLSGVIGSIGARRDPAAVDPLGKYLGNSDPEVVRATAMALGRIGTVAAGKALLDALKDAREDNVTRIGDGLLSCGARLAAEGKGGEAKKLYAGILAQKVPRRIRNAALRGAVLCDHANRRKLLAGMIHDKDYGVFAMALRLAIEVKDNTVTGVLVGEIGNLASDRVIPVVRVLGQRGDKAALPALLEMTRKGEPTLRIEAILSVAEIGDASAVPGLVELIKDPDGKVSQAATLAVAGLPGPEVDSAIVKILENAEPALRIRMIEIAGQRRIAGAIPALQKAMADADISLRPIAIKSYGELAGAAGVPVLTDMLMKATDPREISIFERVISSLCSTARDKEACRRKLIDALSKAGPTVKPALLRTLAVAGGPDALKAVRSSVDDADKDVHAAAIRVISEWPSPDAAPVLLELAQHSSGQVDKILALRGFLGIAMQKSVSAKDKLALCRQAAPMIRRAEEKRMLLGVMEGVTDTEALDLIVSFLDDPAVRQEAVETVLAIAEKRPKKQHTDLARAGLEKVVKVTADDSAARKRAEGLLKQLSVEK